MIRLALIGCGGMGNHHRRALEQLKDRVCLTVAVDIDRERAEQTARLLGCKHAATDVRSVLNDMDAAIVALPHHLHHPAGMDLLAAGKHVLMEKPLANTEAECLDLIRASKAAGVTFMVAYCIRYMPLVVEMERLLKEKTYGDCFQLSIWTEQHTEFPADHWSRSAAKLGGGQFFSHGCHYIDLLLAWMGEPVEGTHIGTNFCTPWMEKEGTSNVSIKFAGGALGYHFGTWGARGTRLSYSFHAHCTEGMLDARIQEGQLFLHTGGREGTRSHEKLLLETDPGKQVDGELKHFINCIETGGRPLTDGPRSLQSLRVIWRLYAAEQRGVVADLRGLALERVQ